MAEQLTLGISLGSDLVFDSFAAGPNRALLETLRALPQQPQFIYLWGDDASGKSHLLHASCRAAGDADVSAALLPCAERAHWSAELLQGWDTLPLVALDDVDALAGDAAWERALFGLFNGLREQNASLLVTANAPPAQIEIELPDLKSRLASMLVFQLQPLSDEERAAALQSKAKLRGMELSTDAARWLITRQSRHMRDLMNILDQLDHASLAAKRRITIPFLRGVLAEPDES